MYSPTQLNIFLDNCPGALAFYRAEKAEQKVDLEADGAKARDVGIAFHVCCHQAALAAKEGKPRIPAVEATALVMAQKMPADWAREAADLALEFLMRWEFIETMQYEHGMAFDEKWREVEWESEQRRLRLVFDIVGILQHQDEVYGDLNVATAMDYKSGWGASSDDLDSPQGLAYSTVLYHLYEAEVDAIEVQILAVRKNRTFKKRWMLDSEEDVADLHRREARLQFYMKTADVTELKPRVGFGCSQCSYTAQCALFQERLKNARDSRLIEEPEEAAKDLVVLERRVDELKEALKAMCKSRGPVVIDGMALGFHETTERKLNDAGKLVDLWFDSVEGVKDDPERAIAACRGLFKAMKPGVTMATEMVRTMAASLGFPTKKAAEEAWMPKLCDEVPKTKFEWKRNSEEPAD
ncbi:MAG: PD-(D/E)XK nuclease family protein [Planctomycetota bacterium]|nr:PD-(D/E)XK nuclease family protein [Planctomycetota bacterium]